MPASKFCRERRARRQSETRNAQQVTVHSVGGYTVATYGFVMYQEARAKASAAGLNNLEIHTFHSLAIAYYGGRGYDDNMIKGVLDTHALRLVEYIFLEGLTMRDIQV